MTAIPTSVATFERPVLTVQEVAEILGVSRWLVQQAARTGELPCIRLGRRILFSRARLESLLTGDAAGQSAGTSPATAVSDPHVRPENSADYPQIVLGTSERQASARP
jgi:excisionase family DNA binding protein